MTEYAIEGTANLVTGSSSGTIHETFVGKTADGTLGTLSFEEKFTVVCPSSSTQLTRTVHIDARMVASTGGFAGSHGHATCDGTLINGPQAGSGTYRGQWVPGGGK